MRGAFVAGLFAGVALGALVVLASQEQNRKVIVVQAGRLAGQARSMMNRGASQVAEVANDIADTVADRVMDTIEDVSEMA